MATETGGGSVGLMRRARATVHTAFDDEASPAQRRRALIKTIGVGSLAVLVPVAGIDGVANDPGLLHMIGMPLSSMQFDVGAGALGVAGGLAAIWTGWDNARQPYDTSERASLRSFFRKVSTGGYVVAGILGGTAIATGVLGAEHLLGDGSAIAAITGTVAAGGAGVGIAGHALKHVWGRGVPERAPLGE